MKHTKIASVALVVSCAFYSAGAWAAGDRSGSRTIAAVDKPAEGWSAPRENRIHRYTYSPDIIYRILTKPTLHTHIELGEDEGLKETPVVGDSVQWRVSGGPRNLYVKPVREDIRTSMTVVTNKRTYQFQLISDANVPSVYQKVSFDYPDREAEIRLAQEVTAANDKAERERLDAQIVAPSIDPALLDFNFEIEGEAYFRPTAVYTDGKFTYLRMPPIQDSPALLLLDELGNPSLINYKVRNDMIVVERVAQRLLLKLGKDEVKVTKVERKGFWR